jgi:hypothetical protein
MADEKTFTQADIDAAIEKAVGPLKDSIGKLEGKNDELISENRKLKRGAEIKPEDLAAAEDRADKAERALAEAQKEAKTATTRAEKAEKALEQETGFTHKLLAENGVVAALTAAGVSDPAYLDAAKALHLPNVKVVADGENRSALYGDKPLADAIKEWAAGDVGKKFVSAPNNSGGGAGGGSGEGGGKTMTRAAYQELATSNPAQANTFVREGGKVVDQAA